MKSEEKNKIVIILLLAVLSMGVNQCSQDANMNMQYASNFFMAPINYLSDVFNGETPSAIRNEYQELKDTPKISTNEQMGLDQICEKYKNWNDDKWSKVGSSLLESFCACNSWDDAIECEPNPKCCNITCPEENRCQKQCPKNKDILKRNKENSKPSKDSHDYFSFLNSGFDTFPNKVRQASKTDLTNEIPSSAYGLGMVSARRKFNELAFFDKTKKPTFEDKIKEKKHYLKKIDDIFEGKPARIEGYANLDEFSGDPLVQKYIKQKITEEWLDRSIGRGLSEKKADPTKTKNKNESLAMVKNIKEHISDTGSVTMTFGYKGPDSSKQPVHSIEVYKVIDSGTSKLLCAHDPNWPVESPIQIPFDAATNSCSPAIEISSSGKPFYKKIKHRKMLNPPIVEVVDGVKRLKKYENITEDRELFDLDFDQQGDEKDAVHAINNLHPFCLEEKKCSKK